VEEGDVGSSEGARRRVERIYRRKRDGHGRRELMARSVGLGIRTSVRKSKKCTKAKGRITQGGRDGNIVCWIYRKPVSKV